MGGDDQAGPPSDTRKLILGELVLERHRTDAGYEVRYKDQLIGFTYREFAVLWALASRVGTVFERGELLERAWGVERVVGPRTIDAHVVKIRRKLRARHVTELDIETVWGIGYRLQDRR